MEQIRQLGKLYDNDMEEETDLVNFQAFLDTYDSGTTGAYDTAYHMKMVLIFRV